MVSPFGGWGSTLALLFVLIVAAIKAFLEDLKRHQEDHATNASIAHRVKADGALCMLRALRCSGPLCCAVLPLRVSVAACMHTHPWRAMHATLLSTLHPCGLGCALRSCACKRC